MKIQNLAALFFASAMLSTISFAQAGDEDKELLNKGKARDQQAIDEAIKGWWTESMKKHDQRIAWWRDAKFGMFIHWGVYSTAGGEWKGKKVSGYAEHLMRKEKILRNEYLDLAHQFNPVKFNAEQWILHAKKAGMKYFIITSKHHDGFALFDSKISDFDVMDQTPFKRDPMAELAAAAKKHGIKFGFYYSHAFDWEHPVAPGNDWEYKNPGGDLNLYGGREWHDLHPELLEKAKKYVDEKAIPQIKELLVKYHPDILWFDTPQKLPLSENIRILKAIREVDQDVVVNGRLVRFSQSNFGDYKNTADRPAEFYPVSGDWEAIPTTNESYGYHKFDSSHKSPAHFIQLLASAASRGGNLLMNIGPKGDGTFDAKDQSILEGIGKWMNKNAESIYGTSRSPLPIQSWGVSTLKENKLYMHVFNWPADGKLYVGGLQSKPKKTYLLADQTKIFPVISVTSGDFYISVPAKAPDSINTVLVVEWEGELNTHPTRVLAPNSKMERLLAFDARQNGKGFGFGDGKTDRFYVEGWKSKEQNLAWDFNTLRDADYKIRIKYLAPGATSGGTYSLVVLKNTVGTTKAISYNRFVVDTTSKNTTVVTHDLGVIPLERGSYILAIEPESISKSELMKLLEVQLIPVSSFVTDPSKIISDADKQTRQMLIEIEKAKAGKTDLVSPRTLSNGELKLVASRDWTSGFFPGVLWFLYDFTKNKEWKAEAEKFTADIEREKTNAGTHDMGFKIYCSFGQGYKITKNAHYKDVIIESARTLSTRFNKISGVIKSWDHSREKWDFPVIIDNMMNLELLFAATKLSGDSSFYKIAVTHANTTLKNHFRADNSSYHVIDYDTATGNVLRKNTHQGYAHESAWSRGQAWGLYGYTMCYRFTKNKTYLKQAEKIADFILTHPNLPKDLVPYWDFNAPDIPLEPRDASAAAIIASALYELSAYSTKGKQLREKADKITDNLGKFYRSAIGENKGFIILHSTGSKPGNSEVDTPLTYADYYFIEALKRKIDLKAGKKLF